MSGGKGTSDWATLYVGDLLPEVTEAHLNEKFSPIGPVAAVHVCRDSITQKSLGYAYVNYYSMADATQALEKLNYTDIRGRCCRIMWNSREKPFERNPAANVFVGNLAPEIDSRALYDTFSIFGHIISCKVATSRDGVSRGYGFVQYESEDAAKQAIDRVNGMVIAGRKVFVGPFMRRNFKKEAESGDDRSVYVRNIPADWDDAQVSELFSAYGTVESSLIMSEGKGSRRHGFVNFTDAAAALKASEELHAKDMRTEEERREAQEGGADKEESKEEEAKEEEANEEDQLEKADEQEGDESKKPEDKLPPYCLSVRPAKGRQQQDGRSKERNEAPPEVLEGVRLIVRSLPPDTDDEKLRSLFEPFGKVTDVKAVQDRETGECRGYGFVRLSTREEASAAVQELHLKEIAPGQPPLSVGLASKGERKGKGEGGKGCYGYGWGKGGGKSKGPLPFDMLRPGDMLGPCGFPPQRPMYPPHPMMGAGPIAAGSRPPMVAYNAYWPPSMVLAMVPPEQRKQMLGEKLFPLVQRIEKELASKITGMLLEMSEMELLPLLESEANLRQKVTEAKQVLLK